MFKRLIIPTLAAAFLAATALAAEPAATAATPATKDQQRFEAQILKLMINQHLGAVKIAELCAGRTTHADLQTLGNDIKNAQTAEIATLQSWLHDWYDVTYTPALDSRVNRQITALGKLTGADFEKQFLRVMIGHHTAAIASGTDSLLRAYHASLINVGATMICDQADEIVQMRLWLSQWYGITDLKPDLSGIWNN